MKCVLVVASRADNANLQRDKLATADGPARSPTEPAPGIYILHLHYSRIVFSLATFHGQVGPDCHVESPSHL